MFSSLKRIVTAPFYAMAMFFSLVYSLISLRGGRIMTGIVEREWNEGVYLSFGFHLFFPNRLWKWEGGGIPKQLGKNGYYINACMQPRYVF